MPDTANLAKNMKWKHYFHFAKDVKFAVDGPGPVNGTGQVNENNDRFLKFSVNVPRMSKKDIVLALTYVKEGAFNGVVVEYDGKEQRDSKATMTSDTKARRRDISSAKIKIGNKPLSLSLAYENDKEIDADLLGYDFDFNRK